MFLNQDYGHRNPLNGITKLAAIATKCSKDELSMEWCLSCIIDRCQAVAGALGDSWSTQSLTGSKDSGKGLLDVYLFKLRAKNYLLQNVMEQQPFPTDAKVKLREVMNSHASYRGQMRPVADVAGLDLTWMSGWKKSMQLFRDLLEETEAHANSKTKEQQASCL